MEMMQTVKMAHEMYANHIRERLTLQNPFLDFKRDPIVNEMLEHVTYEQGVKYKKAFLFNPIFTRFHELLNVLLQAAKENDSIGNPITYPYDILQSKTIISPSSLRYIFYAVQLMYNIHFIDKHDSNKPLNIVEVGGGYGGFCLILLRGLKHIGYKVERYVHYESTSSHKFLFAYLNQFDHGETIVTSESLDSMTKCETKYDYFLSFFCYSELSLNDRQLYLNNVIKYCAHGYIAWNFLPDTEIHKIYELIAKDVTKTIENERVVTGSGNKTVYW